MAFEEENPPNTNSRSSANKENDRKRTQANSKPSTENKPEKENLNDSSDVDMKNLLGYLNQSEWIYSLNIGNIMQIAPLTMQDFMSSSSLEMELSREYVLEKVY